MYNRSAIKCAAMALVDWFLLGYNVEMFIYKYQRKRIKF